MALLALLSGGSYATCRVVGVEEGMLVAVVLLLQLPLLLLLLLLL